MLPTGGAASSSSRRRRRIASCTRRGEESGRFHTSAKSCSGEITRWDASGNSAARPLRSLSTAHRSAHRARVEAPAYAVGVVGGMAAGVRHCANTVRQKFGKKGRKERIALGITDHHCLVDQPIERGDLLARHLIKGQIMGDQTLQQPIRMLRVDAWRRVLQFAPEGDKEQPPMFGQPQPDQRQMFRPRL